eukprot:11175738-Lingulodinium_polyedra.AAC.1
MVHSRAGISHGRDRVQSSDGHQTIVGGRGRDFHGFTAAGAKKQVFDAPRPYLGICFINAVQNNNKQER